jgi:di/tricarboxylate transporter
MSRLALFSISPRKAGLLVLIAAVSAAIAFAPVDGIGQKPMFGLAVVVATVLLFATGALHGLAITAVFFLLALASDTTPIPVLASGLWANATLLIFGGLIIGTAAERSGLGKFIARGVLKPFLGSYPSLLFGILAGCGALGLLVPSTMGRLAITLPIVMSLAREVGYAPGSNGYAAAVLTAVAGNFLTAYGILPANLVNVIANGAAEAQYGPLVGYVDHMLINAPVLMIVKGATFLGLALLLFPAGPPTRPPPEDPVPMGRPARRLAVLLGITVVVWATDFLHGLKPGWVACVAGIACLLPPVSLMRVRETLELNRLNAVLSVPAVLGLASVLTHSGAGDLISSSLMGLVSIQGRSPEFGFATIAVVASVVSLLATTVGTIAIMTPLLGTVAEATGLSLQGALAAEMAGLQSLFFHYEAVPIMVGIAIGRVSPATALRLLAPLAATGLLLIVPLQILWLKLIGIIP